MIEQRLAVNAPEGAAAPCPTRKERPDTRGGRPIRTLDGVSAASAPMSCSSIVHYATMRQDEFSVL
jgi:hypothetical protein